MAHGMMRGAAAAWLGLIALQAFTTKNGADAVGGLLGTVDKLVTRALDPTVPAIPDHSHGGVAGTTDGNGNYHPTVPGWLGGGTTTAPGSDPNGPGGNTSGQQANPNVVPYDPPPTGQPNPAYGPGTNVVPDAYRIPGINA